jgi:VIT1/CCC1 family predicted Fe2+/Mn2+ transporter
MLTRSLEKAKEAYLKKDIDGSKKAHEGGVEDGEHHNFQGQYIKSWVYGGLDGIITTFAVVAGVAGASLSAGVVLILGFANLIADGLSMAVGDYLSTKSENEYNAKEREREAWEVENYPEGEKKEMVEIYMEKGMSKEDAEKMTEVLSRNKEAWISVMMVEELGIIEDDESPFKNALVTFASFAIFGFVPLLAYILARFIPFFENNTFTLAIAGTGITMFLLGALKARITGRKWWKAGFEMLIVGGVAASAAYFVGVLLKGLA